MTDMLTIVLPATWAFFTTYLLWFVASAKRNATITFDDAKALWEIHKAHAKCASHKWRPLSCKNGKISGFECECGYKYLQKRPIFSSKPKNSPVSRRSQSAFSVAPY